MRSEEPDNSQWPLTIWSELALPEHDNRLNDLILRYQKPLKVYFLGKFPNLRAHADEVLLNFAEDKLLKKSWREIADPGKGRFRDFLKKCLYRFVLDWIRRHPQRPDVPEDWLDEIPAPGPAEDDGPFALEWVRMVLSETLRGMEQDCKDAEREQPRGGHIWEVFRLRMLEPIFNEGKPMPYAQLVRHLELRSPAEASNMLLGAKRIYRRHLDSVIKAYEKREGAVKAELEELKEILSQFTKEKGKSATQDSPEENV